MRTMVKSRMATSVVGLAFCVAAVIGCGGGDDAGDNPEGSCVACDPDAFDFDCFDECRAGCPAGGNQEDCEDACDAACDDCPGDLVCSECLDSCTSEEPAFRCAPSDILVACEDGEY